MALAFSLNYRVLILAALLMPVLLGLGYWQLQRAAEKESIQHTYQQRQQQTPMAFDDIHLDQDLAFLPVTVNGRFDRERQFLLDNRIQRGQVGYDVLTPVRTANGGWLMVNRGWIKAPALRSELPGLAPLPETAVELLARVYVPPGNSYQLSGMERGDSPWPKVITVFDSEFIGEQLGVKLFPYELRLQSGQLGALVTNWPAINVSPAKHRAYALQWFAMATALLIWLAVASMRKR